MEASTLAVIAVIGSLLIAGGMLVAGVVFMFSEKAGISEGHSVEIDLPYVGKLQTNFPAIGFAALGAVLVYLALTLVPLDAPDRFPIQTNVTLDGLEASDQREVVVGIIPGSYLRLNSLPEANEVLSPTIDVVEGEGSYTGVAFVRGPQGTLLDIGAVSTEDGEAFFNAKLGP